MPPSIPPSRPPGDFEALPFPPGESPCHVKGIFYRGSLEYIDRVVPGGVAAVLATFRSAALRRFLAQPFVAASLYDVFPLVPLGYPSAQLCGQSVDRFLRQRAKFQAEEQASSVYRSLLSLTSPAAVALKLPLLAAQLYDFGATEARQVGRCTVEVVRSGLPVELLPWYVPGTESYVSTALRLSGARSPRASTSPFRLEKKEGRLTLGAVTHTFSWQETPAG